MGRTEAPKGSKGKVTRRHGDHTWQVCVRTYLHRSGSHDVERPSFKMYKGLDAEIAVLGSAPSQSLGRCNRWIRTDLFPTGAALGSGLASTTDTVAIGRLEKGAGSTNSLVKSSIS